MTELKTKYSIGDVVYQATTKITQKSHPCPDCKGQKKWKAISPAGLEYNFECPRCTKNYRGDKVSLDYQVFEAVTRRRTIGSVRVDTSDKDSVSYMCSETGVGSGTVYYEKDLFATEEEALIDAALRAIRDNESTKWIVEQYQETLAISDYQLADARNIEAQQND